MIHYHGTPITPGEAAVTILTGRHAMVSFARPDNLGLVGEVCQSFCIDNGAFSHWKKGTTVNWQDYYKWVAEVAKHPSFDWAVLPDVIDGGEKENDDLLREWPFDKHIAMPVWHLHESLERLDRLCTEWPRVAFGSSGQFKTPGSKTWKVRMNEVRHTACDKVFQPRRPFHMLRGLNPDHFTKIAAKSADSTTVAINIGMDCNWPEIYKVASKGVRGIAYATRLEAFQSTPVWLEFDVDAPLVTVAPDNAVPKSGMFWTFVKKLKRAT